MPVYFPTSYITRGSFPGQFLPIVHSVFLSLMFLFIGAFFVAHRKHFPNGELWFLAGMFYVFAGIAETSFPSIYVPSWTAIAAGSLGALCLLTSRSEERYEVVEFARDDLRVGAVGQVFLLASAAIMIVGYAVWTLSKSHGIDFYQIFAPWGLVSSGALLVFGALVAVSMVRITPKLGGNKLGTAGASMAVVSAITGMLYYDLTISYVAITVPSGGASDLNALGVTLLTSYNVLVWITMTLLGAFLLLHHKSVPSSELWIVGGLIFIATGSYQFSIGLFVYIPIPLLVTGAVGIACFLAGKPAK